MSKVTVGGSYAYQWATLFIKFILPQEEVITALCVHGFHKIKQVRKLNSNYSTNKEIVVACIIFNEKHHCKE